MIALKLPDKPEHPSQFNITISSRRSFIILESEATPTNQNIRLSPGEFYPDDNEDQLVAILLSMPLIFK